MNTSPRRQDVLGEGGVDDISDEGTKLYCTLFFKTKEGIRRELSVEFDLMRDKNGRISELEAGLNAEGFKSGGGRRTGVSVGRD